MQKCYSFFAVFLSLLLHVQNMAWAAGSETAQSKMKVEEFVRYFNNMSSNSRAEIIKEMIAARPKADQDFINQSLGDLSKVTFPTLKVVKDSIAFTWQKTDVLLAPVKDAVVKVNGEAIDFAPGKFSEAAEKMDKIFSHKTVSVMNFIISPAYANTAGVVAIGGIIAIIIGFLAAFSGIVIAGAAVAVFGGFGAAANMFNDQAINQICSEARKKMSALSSGASPSEIFEVKQRTMRGKSDIEKHELCLNGDAERLQICSKVRACLESLEREIDIYLNAVNTDARETVKDLERSFGSKKIDKESSGQ